MKPALLLVDLQSDFLRREGLVPAPARIVSQCELLLTDCRKLQIPVLHIWTKTRKDGADRMPHWKRDNIHLCVEGTPGMLPPAGLQPQNHEAVFTKQFYSGFSNPALAEKLNGLGVDTIIIAGIYLHGCVRSTVLDACQLGYEVWIADDATGSTEPDHAEITREYLEGRAARFADTRIILSMLGAEGPSDKGSFINTCPVAGINGDWKQSRKNVYFVRRNPSRRDEVIASVPSAENSDIDDACRSASVAGNQWKNVSVTDRIKVLAAWVEELRRRSQDLVRLLALETGKPVTDGNTEIDKSISLIQAATALLENDNVELIDKEGPVHVRYCPQGVIGLITSWNNPVAIPAGKIAPALAFGNTVVWKPAIEAPQTAMTVVNALYESGAPRGILNLVFGEAGVSRNIVRHPLIAAVSFTGSIGAGRSIAALCGRYGKLLQAELGGNNAAIVMSDCDFHAQILDMAVSAYSFAGQRCTATQRFIVEKAVLEKFTSEFVDAVKRLRIGDPFDPSTEIGPLVSEAQCKTMQALLDQARADGAIVHCGGMTPDIPQHGCWFAPAVISNVRHDSILIREEIFGPLAVIIPADDFDHAIAVANSVKHGLLATLYSHDQSKQQKFANTIECGILNFAGGLVNVHPKAPFGGWKASGIGIPEHGIWDRQFYCRTQAIYGYDHRKIKQD
jgi:acyl-CoA reductase-like NAD-dependent aldehyde dehydrogenase/nicotinamidase-related amidase